MKTQILILLTCALAVGCSTTRRSRGVAVTPLPEPEPAPVTRSAVVAREAPAQDGESLELKKEAFHVERSVVSNGAAVIRKRVTSENVSVPVTLTTEDFVVERIAGGDPTTPWGDEEVVFSLPLTRETARPVITTTVERLVVRKTKGATTQEVGATIRTETADVVRQE